jgi:hypothetical protein
MRDQEPVKNYDLNFPISITCLNFFAGLHTPGDGDPLLRNPVDGDLLLRTPLDGDPLLLATVGLDSPFTETMLQQIQVSVVKLTLFFTNDCLGPAEPASHEPLISADPDIALQS